jgi:hypothetical protein
MRTKVYTLLGWFAWQGIAILVRRAVAQNKVKIGAAATVFAVIAAGILAARTSSSNGD